MIRFLLHLHIGSMSTVPNGARVGLGADCCFGGSASSFWDENLLITCCPHLGKLPIEAVGKYDERRRHGDTTAPRLC